MKYLCPVCGYSEMERPPEDYNICPCCGTEFGYEDFADTDQQRKARWIELRQRWLDRGARWFSPVVRPPLNWNPVRQLIYAGLLYDIVSDADLTTVDVPTDRELFAKVSRVA